MAREQERWLEALRKREEEAVRWMVAEFSAPLGRYLLGMVRHQGEAEDLVQETFMRFLSRLDSFRGEASVKSYLFKIATNLAINHIQSAPARREVYPGDMPDSAGDADPHQEADRSESSARVRSAVASLPPQQRAVVVLKAWADLTFREIASAIGIAEGTAKAHYFFALRKLRGALGVRDDA